MNSIICQKTETGEDCANSGGLLGVLSSMELEVAQGR